jgi:hypothetical protein
MAIASDKLDNVITKTEARETILRSGYLLESRVESLLRGYGFSVEPNVFYPDPQTGKGRELDLYATNFKKVNLSSDASEFCFAFLSDWLLVECVNNPQPIAFIENATRAGDINFCTNVSVYTPKIIGYPETLKISEHGYSFNEEISEFVQKCQSSPSREALFTQYFSFSTKKSSKEWMASHDPIHFESLSKLTAVLNFKITRLKEWVTKPLKSARIYNLVMIVVVQNDLWTVKQNETGDIEITEVEYVPFLIAHTEQEEGKYYQIDIVKESFLQAYIENLEQKRINLAEHIQNHKSEIKQALEESYEDNSSDF